MPAEDFTHELQADTSGDPLLILLTITHMDLAEPLRFVRNHVDIVSRDWTFTAFPFEFVPPGQGEDGATPARIVIDNIDRRIVETLRALATPPAVLAEIVLGSDPDTVHESFPVFEINSATGDRMQVSAQLADLDDDGEPAIRWSFLPSTAPALFR